MLLATTSDNIDPFTVRNAASGTLPATVAIYELTAGGAVKVDPNTYESQPAVINDNASGTAPCAPATAGQCFAPAIGLQPAAPAAAHGAGEFGTSPFKENTTYAVIISDGVTNATGIAIERSTVAKILLFSDPLISTSGGTTSSNLQGIDAGTAATLEQMRQQLIPALAQVQTDLGISKDHVATAYTFRTQTITGVKALTDPTAQQGALQVAALPYGQAPATALPGAVTPAPGAGTATVAFSKYGVDPSIPHGNIAEVLETTITTFNLLSPSTGAFDPSGATAAETINVMIATPHPTGSTIQNCTGSLTAFGSAGLRCAPMVIYRHGLNGGRAEMLTLADSITAQGMVLVAIDAAKHGDRAFCTGGDTTTTLGSATVPVCADGTSACTTALPAGAQGDAHPPGTCGAVGYFRRPVSAVCGTGGCPAPTSGIPVVSGNYLISANLFRTRDTLRQDIIDESQLVRAIAFAPSGAPPTGHAVFDRMATTGVIIDPARVYFIGQSLGAIQGTADVAVNPRIGKVVLNVGGGTLTDVLSQSPSFNASVNALLASLGSRPAPRVICSSSTSPSGSSTRPIRSTLPRTWSPRRCRASSPCRSSAWRCRPRQSSASALSATSRCPTSSTSSCTPTSGSRRFRRRSRR
jgi:hypothetical protein